MGKENAWFTRKMGTLGLRKGDYRYVYVRVSWKGSIGPRMA